MKNLLKTLPVAGALFLSAALVHAQDFQTRYTEDTVPTPPYEFYDVQSTGQGVISAALESGEPIQLINPAAPERFGDGRRFVSVDPRTGEPRGIKLIDITW